MFITLTRFRGQPMSLDTRTIETIEIGSETRIHLTSGQDLIVQEPAAEVLRRIVEEARFRRTEPPRIVWRSRFARV